MYVRNWKKDILTIPNLLSLLRLMLIPVYISIYLNARDHADYILAAAILAVSCLTDLVDGKIARHFNMITDLGKFLDPLADKLTQFALILCLSAKYPVMVYVICLFFIKELFQLLAFAYSIRKGLTMTGALLPGKICTTILFVSLIIMVLMPNIDGRLVSAFAIVDSIFLLFAFTNYTVVFLSKKHRHKMFFNNPDSNEDSF